eukprot:403334365
MPADSQIAIILPVVAGIVILMIIIGYIVSKQQKISAHKTQILKKQHGKVVTKGLRFMTVKRPEYQIHRILKELDITTTNESQEAQRNSGKEKSKGHGNFSKKQRDISTSSQEENSKVLNTYQQQFATYISILNNIKMNSQLEIDENILDFEKFVPYIQRKGLTMYSPDKLRTKLGDSKTENGRMMRNKYNSKFEANPKKLQTPVEDQANLDTETHQFLNPVTENYKNHIDLEGDQLYNLKSANNTRRKTSTEQSYDENYDETYLQNSGMSYNMTQRSMKLFNQNPKNNDNNSHKWGDYSDIQQQTLYLKTQNYKLPKQHPDNIKLLTAENIQHIQLDNQEEITNQHNYNRIFYQNDQENSNQNYQLPINQ